MRIDPEAVYLELDPAVTVFNHTEHTTRTAPAAILHWKDGNRWQRRSFIANENNGDTLGAIMARVGGWIDKDGLAAALEEAMGR